METVLAFVIGGLVAAGVYLVLQRNLLKFIFGLMMLSNAANLVIFVAGRLVPGRPPLIPEGADRPAYAMVANPLPQALVLTAIVIGFGLVAFALVMLYRAYRAIGTIDIDELLDEPLEPGRAA
jgi:multicomponent Na+:H+ antiporter subunit C